jgi:2-phospho-L-lactate guanylyltransferase
MARDVVAAIRGAGADPRLLSTGPIEGVEGLDALAGDVPVVVDDRSLTAAVDGVVESFEADDARDAVAVLMADLPLATPEAVGRLLDADGDVVLVPGRGGGTNAVVVRVDGFRVDYHGVSLRDHRRTARDLGATVGDVDSFRLSTDVDEPADLVEVLLHGAGAAADWLVDAGFDVAVDDAGGRVRVTRT